MTASTLIYIIIAGIAALLLALFQYLYKSKRRKLNVLLTFLRFLSYFFILLLLINPKFEKATIYNEKPSLVVATDNSESIKHLNQVDNVNSTIKKLINDKVLNNHFDIEYYQFGETLTSEDSLSFNDPQSDISTVFSGLSQVYKNGVAPMLLITDGNQTFGTDYEYSSQRYKQPVFPIILGDTISYSDLKIQQLNVNKYAYLKNSFPVEVFMTYSGNRAVSSQLIITSGNTRVYSKNLNFSKENNSQVINLTLPANSVGVRSYTATIVPLDSEKNKVNNTKPFAVEVIDQKTNVALVSTIIHPDLGALKKSIESNEQRSVSIIKPSEYVRTKDNYQLAIMYQPNTAFRGVFDLMKASNYNMFVITGPQTNWSFLNLIQDNYKQEITSQSEDYQAEINTNYGTFILDNLDFESFPPIKAEFGELTITAPHETILYKNINGNILNEPLLFTFENNARREAVLLGEGLWRWRAQSYLNTRSFQTFDNFVGKLVQYLASNQKRKRLTVNYESFYNGNGNIKITSQFFNKNYEFDNKASLEIVLKNIETETTQTIPFIIKQNNYQVDLSGLEAGDYTFTVKANNNEASQTGRLTILDYNVEQQFLNANVLKLQQLATNSKGSAFFVDNTDALVAQLINDSRFATIQKSSKKVVPLIDFKILLALIALSLAIEWFIRKFNGLI